MSIKIIEYSDKLKEDYIKVNNEGFKGSWYAAVDWPTAKIDDIEGDAERIFLAYDGNKCVGQITLTEQYGKKSFCIASIAVLPAYRYKNIGSSLIKKAGKYAKTLGKESLICEVMGSCTELFEFFHVNGFYLMDVKYRLESLVEGKPDTWKPTECANREDIEKLKKQKRVFSNFIVWLIFKKEV